MLYWFITIVLGYLSYFSNNHRQVKIRKEKLNRFTQISEHIVNLYIIVNNLEMEASDYLKN